jgi:hypothetical protein
MIARLQVDELRPQTGCAWCRSIAPVEFSRICCGAESGIGPEPTCEKRRSISAFGGYNRHSNFRASLPFLTQGGRLVVKRLCDAICGTVLLLNLTSSRGHRDIRPALGSPSSELCRRLAWNSCLPSVLLRTATSQLGSESLGDKAPAAQ